MLMVFKLLAVKMFYQVSKTGLVNICYVWIRTTLPECAGICIP